MFQILSRLVTIGAGILYPSYASYKAVKSNDLQKLEVWLMYWTVMGVVMALESTVEWLFAWFPFYYEFKTLAILWLTLPQIQGSTYIYVAHLHPFLADHESDIDAALADAKVRAKQVGLEWLNKAVQRLRQAVIGSLAPQLLDEPSDNLAARQQHPPATEAGATSQLYNLAGTVLRTYGPAAVAAGSAFLHPMNGRAPSVRAAGTSTGRPSSGGEPRLRAESFLESPRSNETFPATATASGRSVSMTSIQARMRRAELEAQLAELHNGPAPPVAAKSSNSSSSSLASKHSASSLYGGAPSLPYDPRTFHPRSVSAGPYPASLSVGGGRDRSRTPSPNSEASLPPVPRDPVAMRVDRSFVRYGFEEIARDELDDYPPVSAAAMDAGQTSPGGTRRASWWFWAKSHSTQQVGPQQQATAAAGEKEKDA